MAASARRDSTGTFKNCQFSVRQDRVPRQQVLRTGDEGMQAENWGFLAWRTSSRPGSQADPCYTKCIISSCSGQWEMGFVGFAGSGKGSFEGVRLWDCSNARNRVKGGSKWENEEKLVYMGYKC